MKILDRAAIAALALSLGGLVACGNTEAPAPTESAQTASGMGMGMGPGMGAGMGPGMAEMGMGPGAGMGEMHGMHAGMGGHGAMPPTVHEYHEVLRVVWHGPTPGENESEGRVERACASGADLVTRADAVVNAPAPEGIDAAAWTGVATGLKTASAGIVTACEAETLTDEQVSGLHDAFHAVIDLIRHH